MVEETIIMMMMMMMMSAEKALILTNYLNVEHLLIWSNFDLESHLLTSIAINLRGDFPILSAR